MERWLRRAVRGDVVPVAVGGQGNKRKLRMFDAKRRRFADSRRGFRGNGLIERSAVRLEMMMGAKRGKMRKGGLPVARDGNAVRFASAGDAVCGWNDVWTMCWAVRFDSLDRRVGTASGDGCALRVRALQVLRSGHSWELLCKSGIARGNWSIDGLIDRYARFAR